jgi:hypothetical protein
MDLLYITTVGARSGQQRTNPVARRGRPGRFGLSSPRRAARQHPAYHNLAAHPDQVWVSSAGRSGE